MVALSALTAAATLEARDLYLLNDNWRSVCYPEGRQDSLVVKDLQLPHNWDDYYGYRQQVHGNLHGRARYERKFSLRGVTREANSMALAQKHYNLRLEGVGTYVSVWLNGFEVCRHKPAGRVVTDLDITEYLRVGDPLAENLLIIECDHPSGITDMPWVCGGCSSEPGFSEGSAPFGLFRNVLIEATDQLRIEPFGVHAWASDALDTIFIDTEIHNYSSHGEECVLQTITEGKVKKEYFQVGARTTYVAHQVFPLAGTGVVLTPWSPENPKLYTVSSTVMHGSQHVVADKTNTQVGFAQVKWPARTADGRLNDSDHRFYLNGKPVFINGTSEYEHLYGQSHALLFDEIDRRCALVKQMGFNAFRDAHQPHNLRYQELWAQQGVMWWPQFSAHIWYDTPQFRENFKTLLRQWVKERRNNPAIILWGLQNESVLPEDFARECCDIIREMDPKCARSRQPGGSQTGRLITTCNGGRGTDWNVIQNWSGTYGGDVNNYGQELAQDDQLLNGEYGGWRSYNFHDMQDRQNGFDPQAPWSEEHQSELLHAKMKQAYQNRDKLCGQFQWPLFSHDNPGRQQPDEGYRLIDKIGPFNYKGLISAYWEPVDAYYLYITWGAFLRGEWPAGLKNPMELTAREMVILGYKHEGIPLPDYLLDPTATEAACRPELHKFAAKTSLLAPEEDRTYVYRYNCGGDQVTDSYGNVWMGDDTRYCENWSMSEQFAADHLNPVLGSQDYVRGWALDPVQDDGKLLCAKADQNLLRSYRFGRHALKFSFPMPVGRLAQVDMWFVNTRHYVYHVSYKTRVGLDGQLVISFPHVKIGQAKVSCIAISMDRLMAKDYGKTDRVGVYHFKEGVLNPSHPAVTQSSGYPYSEGLTWEKLNKMVAEKMDKASLPATQNGRRAVKFPAELGKPSFNIEMGVAQEYAFRVRYKNESADVRGRWKLISAQDGRVVKEGDISFPQTPAKFKVANTTTGGYVNAGQYRLIISDVDGVEFESVEVQ